MTLQYMICVLSLSVGHFTFSKQAETMATSVYLLMLVCCVSSISACKDLQDVFIEMRDYFRDVALPRRYDTYKEEASFIGIDLDNDEQILNLACGLVDVESMEDVITLLGLSDEDTWAVPQIIGNFIYSNKKELEIWPEVRAEYEAAFQFLADTNFPEFPLGLSKEEALAFVQKAGRNGLERIFGHNSPSSNSFEWFADALAESQTLEEFNYNTYGNFKVIVSDFDGKLNEMRARYNDATLRPLLQTRLLTILKKYGIPNSWPEYTAY